MKITLNPNREIVDAVKEGLLFAFSFSEQRKGNDGTFRQVLQGNAEGERHSGGEGDGSISV